MTPSQYGIAGRSAFEGSYAPLSDLAATKQPDAPARRSYAELAFLSRASAEAPTTAELQHQMQTNPAALVAALQDMVNRLAVALDDPARTSGPVEVQPTEERPIVLYNPPVVPRPVPVLLVPRRPWWQRYARKMLRGFRGARLSRA